MLRALSLLLPAAVCAAFTLPAQRVFACGGSGCDPDQFVPRSGAAPANAAIAWWPGEDFRRWRDDADGGAPDVMTSALDLEFTCVDIAGVTREIAYEVGMHADHSYIRPKSALTAGERCNLRSRVVDCDLTGYDFIEPELWKSQDRGYLTSRASFVVAAAAPLPAALGRLALEPAALERIELSEGSGCNVRQEVCAIRASIELSDEARAWQDELVYETWIDGARWRVQLAAPLPLEEGASYLGRGREIFFAYRPGVRQMADVRGLSVGKHEVVVRASLPDTNVAIATEPVSIDLDCFASSGAAGGGADAAIDAGSTPDAATEPDAGGDAGAPAKPRRERPETRSSSCSCEAVGARAGGADSLLCVVVAALALYRRRRKASSTARNQRGHTC